MNEAERGRRRSCCSSSDSKSHLPQGFASFMHEEDIYMEAVTALCERWPVRA